MPKRIDCQTLCFSYARQDALIKNLSFELYSEEVINIDGPNGSGKTTLLNIIMGLLNFSKGSLWICGQASQKIIRSFRAQNIAYVRQQPEHNSDFTVHDILAMGRFPHMPLGAPFTKNDTRLIEQGLDHFHLNSYRNHVLSQLSCGEQQRVWLAQALVQQPKVLLLDESFAFMDNNFKEQCWQAVSELKAPCETGIILISHDHLFRQKVSDRHIYLNHHDV